MRLAAAVLALAVMAVGAAAPAPANALPPGAASRVAPVFTPGTGGFEVVDTARRELTVVRDFSHGETTLQAATTSDGVPVIVSGVATGERRRTGPHELRGLGIASAATPGSVALAWTAIPDAGAYAVYRDGILLGVGGGLRFVDRDVTPGTSHRYTVEADVLLEPEPVEDPETGDTLYPERWTGYRLHIPVAVPGVDGGDVASTTEDFAALTTAQSTSTFTYKTFIAEPTADGAPCVIFPADTYFGGDDRDWVSGTEGSSRTRMTATADWETQGLATSRHVSATTNYHADGTERETRTASDSAMQFLDIDVTSTRASFRIDHSAANPFCESIGSVRYNVAVSVYRNGVYILTGWRRPVPHHEAYVRHDSDAWHTVLRRTSSGLHCLVDLCGTETLNEGGNF